jgi:hypothetical protein
MKNKGITLLSLVITVIIMIILAGVTINLTIGDSSIFKNGVLAREETKKAQIKEYLDLKLLDEQLSNYNGTAEVIIGKTRENVYNNQDDLKKMGNEVEIQEAITTEEESLFYVIVDKYVYKVSMDGTTYEGEQTGEDTELQEGAITFGYTPNNYTNGSVKVKITTNANPNEYTIEYREQNETTWKKYTGEIEVSVNKSIYARLKNVMGATTIATGTVNIIDALKPNTPTINVETTTNTLNITASATDQDATTDYVCSGIAGYCFSIDGEKWTDYQKSGEYTYNDGITQGTNYTVYVKAKDNAGNECEIPASKTVKTLYDTVTTKLKVGDYVSYSPTSQSYTLASTDTGTSSDQTFKTGDYTGLWRVIYNDSTGVELISASSVINLTMNGKVGYNKLVATLNTIASKYVNTTYASSGRSVGSNRTSPTGASSYYTNSSYSYIASSAKDMIVADSDYKTDFNAMTNAGMANIGADYWMASRYIYADSNGAAFHGVVVDSTGSIINLGLRCTHSYGESTDHEYTKGVRVVVKLNNNDYITSGSGTTSSPYSIAVPKN